MSSRTFTLDEAQDLVPVLESLLRTSIDGKKLMESVDAEFQEITHRVFLSGGIFPCEVDGEIVLLCWKLGESAITHWHGTNEGFAGRKPVDERIHKAKRTN